MELTIVWYIRMSVIYFVAGAAIGIGMLIWPGETGLYVPVHVHLNLLGFMSMMIYGVGYHILPKFSGKFIYSTMIMKVQFWLSNAGLLGMAICWPIALGGDSPTSEVILIAAAFISLLATILFAFNMLKTIKSV